MPRSNYHHGDLKSAMIEAALELVETKGMRGFSMREAAREAGVAPSAPYRHFEDKLALMTAVAEAALAELIERTERAIASAGDSPLEQFRAAGIAYVHFAYERRAHFRVLHDPEYARRENSELLARYHARGDALISSVIAAADAKGQFPEALPAELVEFTASTLIYGMARRIVDGQLDPAITLEQVDELTFMMTQMLGDGFVAR